ncbi:hypothetical protein L2E82_18458 [Cichorium intybus]|uniref:Uncharacterized protein n=1 Tax=Cichorium intybus TaxID=13427 RepID=A0ACB9FBL4_CICIN|nr:hypothetical protein L2E82_18458 [Cichorium intybus]
MVEVNDRIMIVACLSSSSDSDIVEDNDGHGYVVDEDLVDEKWADDGKCKERIQEECNGVEEEGVGVQEECIGVLEGVSTKELAIVVAKILDDIEVDDKAEDEHIMRLLRESGYENNEILVALQEHIKINVPEDAPTTETQEFMAEPQHGSPIVTQDVEVEGIEDTNTSKN